MTPAKKSKRNKRKDKFQVLFVCTGNTCRSPMAEALFRDLLRREELQHLVATSSAGLMAPEGSPASPQAVEVAAERGLDLSRHHSRQLTERLLLNADLVVGMQQSHLIPLQQLEQVRGKELILISELCRSEDRDNEASDVPDPYGGGLENYRDVMARLSSCMEGLLEHVRKRMGR